MHIHPDRLDIENPGGLAGGLTPEDLGSRSVRRNRLVADLLFRAGYCEQIGSGIDRMRQACISNKNPLFQITAGNFFLIRFYPRPIPAVAHELTTRQTSILRLLKERGALSAQELARGTAVSKDTALRDLDALVHMGIVSKTGRGRATRYALSAKPTV